MKDNILGAYVGPEYFEEETFAEKILMGNFPRSMVAQPSYDSRLIRIIKKQKIMTFLELWTRPYTPSSLISFVIKKDPISRGSPTGACVSAIDRSTLPSDTETQQKQEFSVK